MQADTTPEGRFAPKNKVKGRAHQLQQAIQNETERKALEAELLVNLGRTPTAVDRAAVETLSGAMIKLRRLRERGYDDREQCRLVAQLLRTTGLRPDKPTKAPTKSFVQRIEEEEAADGEVMPA
jgi:hypothetical protein